MKDLIEYKIIKYQYNISNEELTLLLWDKMNFNETKWAVKLTIEGVSDSSEDGEEKSWDIVFLEPKLEKKIDEVLGKYGIEYVKIDMTELLLKDIDSFSMDFLGKLDDYLIETLTVDRVLDGILDDGIENMSIFERYYLSRISAE
jgi:cellobiose-specific phosphotransferase system component IIB